jgi:hypothetical protein
MMNILLWVIQILLYVRTLTGGLMKFPDSGKKTASVHDLYFREDLRQNH